MPIDEEIPTYRIEMIFQTLQSEAVICDQSTLIPWPLGYQGRIFIYDQMVKTKPQPDRLRQIRDRAIDTDPIYIVFTSRLNGSSQGCRGLSSIGD